MPLIEPVRVEGLRELIRTLRQIDSPVAKALRLVANRAAEIVVAEARRDVPVRSGRAAASIRAKSTRAAARVTSGGRKAPYMPWLDYGGKVGKNNTAERPFLGDGRYVYPAFRSKREEFSEEMRRGMQEIIRDAGLAD